MEYETRKMLATDYERPDSSISIFYQYITLDISEKHNKPPLYAQLSQLERKIHRNQKTNCANFTSKLMN